MVSLENALEITLYNATRTNVLRLRHLLVRINWESHVTMNGSKR